MSSKVSDAALAELAADEAQRAMLDFAVSHSPAIFYVAELGGKQPIRFISANVEAITGHKVPDFLADANYGRDFIHPEDLPGYHLVLRRLKRDGALTHEYRFAGRDGEYRWFRDELRLVGKDRKKSTEFVGCMIDISAEREAAEKLRQAEGVNDAIIRTAMDAIVSADEYGVVIEFNAAAEAMFGYSRKEAVGRSLSELIIPEAYRKQHEAGIAKALETGKSNMSNRRMQVEAMRADGSTFPVELTIGRADLGSHSIFVGEVRDMTKQRRDKAERKHLSSVLDNALKILPSGLAVTGAKGKILLCNDAFAQPFGATAADIIGRDKSDVFAELMSKVESFEEGPATGGPVGMADIEGWMVTGTLAPLELKWDHGGWALLSCTPTQDGGFVTVLTDVSALKTAELEQRNTEELIRHVVENSPVPISMVRMEDAAIIYESPAMRELFGVLPETKGTHVRDFAADLAEQKSLARKVLREGDIDGYEMLFRKNDGTKFWGEISVRTVEYHGETAAVAAIVDLTERRENEEMIRRILEASPAPITMVGRDDGRIIYCSPAQLEIFGYEEFPENMKAFDLYTDSADRDRFVAELKNSGRVDGFEAQMKRCDGSEFWAAISARALVYRGRDVLVSVTQDMTDQLEVEAEMERQREALHQREKLSALGEVLAGVAHELNNPLSVVVGQALMLKETAEKPKNIERARKISEAADRCARIVKTFLAMARQQPAESVPVDVNELVESAIEVTGYSLRSADIDIVLKLAPDLPPVLGDASQLGQVVTNLLVNAQQALEDVRSRRRVEVSTEFDKREGTVDITIRDNGPGIPADLKARIFEPLFTTKGVGSGTGIGLALCNRIVEVHGGKIKLESREGYGARFAIHLPASTLASRAPEEIEESRDADRPLRTLVIDDEEDVADLLAEILELAGYEVMAAGSGAEALRLIEREDFDVVLSDVRMPHLDGPALYSILRERKPDLADRLAFVTGDTMSPKARRFLESTDRPYIEKPINPKEVRALVLQLLEDA
jgi:PAS domain S-box-containing protein